MGFLDFFKNKESEPFHHKGEKNIILREGKHYVIDCENVVVSGRAIVLETTNSSFSKIYGKARIQVFNSGKIDLLCGHAVVGFFKSGFITKIKDKASITTVNDCEIQYVKGKSKIGTFNDGLIKFLDEKSKIETFNNGKILFMRNKSSVGTLIDGHIANAIDNTKIITVMQGKVEYLTNKAIIGTINNGNVLNVCDNSKVSTLNNGTIHYMMGDSEITNKISGEIKEMNGMAKIVYNQNSPQIESVTKKNNKSKKAKEEPKEEVFSFDDELPQDESDGKNMEGQETIVAQEGEKPDVKAEEIEFENTENDEIQFLDPIEINSEDLKNDIFEETINDSIKKLKDVKKN